MRKYAILFLLFLLSNVSSSQNLCLSDSIYEYISCETYKNIAAFNIKNNKHSVIGIDKSSFLNENRNFFFDAYIADYGFKLKMDIKKLPENYPLHDYELYQVYIEDFKFTNEEEQIEVKHGGIERFSFDRYYLLALDKEKKLIKFISGQLFRNTIGCDFNLDFNNPNSFIKYLEFKTFLVQTSDIVFTKNSRNALYFRAYSREAQGYIMIKLLKKNIENPIVYVDK